MRSSAHQLLARGPAMAPSRYARRDREIITSSRALFGSKSLGSALPFS